LAGEGFFCLALQNWIVNRGLTKFDGEKRLLTSPMRLHGVFSYNFL